jgi:hypothetical protein
MGRLIYLLDTNIISEPVKNSPNQNVIEKIELYYFTYRIDTQSDVRKNPKISRTKHNVFGIQTSVAVYF